MKVCVIGASGKLGRYLVQHALDRGFDVVGVRRERSVGKLNPFKGRIDVVPGETNDRDVMKKALAGCDAVLTVLVPWGVRQYSSGTAQAVLDHARPGARLVFSCGWHITRDGQDEYSWTFQEEGDSQGLPVWSRHVGDPILRSNITRRVDFALFMVEALENDDLIQEAPAIVGCRTPSAITHGAATVAPGGSVRW